MPANGSFLRVKNFEKFQHYKERNPPWIKLHSAILDDFEFNNLPETARFHLVAVWILASKLQNRIPFNPDFIKKRINAGKSFNLQLLINKGFLIVEQDASKMLDASNMLAECKQNADSETEERRDRGETETEALPPWLPENLWNDFLGMRKTIRKPATDRAKKLIIAKLEKYQNQGHDPVAILEQSVRNSWQDVYQIKQPKEEKYL